MASSSPRSKVRTPPSSWTRPNLVLQAVRARSCYEASVTMEARTLFMRHCGKVVGDKTWEALIADRFAALRAMGCSRSLMEEIERRFAGTEVIGVS